MQNLLSNVCPRTVMVSIACLGVWVAAPVSASAEISVYVSNCDKSNNTRMRVCSFDAKDNSRSIAYTQKGLGPGDTKTYKCRGQGKGKCQITISWHGTDCASKALDRWEVKDGDTLYFTKVGNLGPHLGDVVPGKQLCHPGGPTLPQPR